MSESKRDEPPWKVPRWIWKNPKIKPGAMRDVLVVILWHQGSNETAWPTIATIATEAGYSDRAVRAAILDLEKLGFLTVDRRGRSRGLASHYVVVEQPIAAPDPDDETREKPRQILPEVADETREKPRQILPDPPAKSAGPHRQNLPDPPAKSAGQEEPDQRTRSVEPDQGTDFARAHARAEESEPMAWTSYVLRRLLMEAVERVIGSQPEIEGEQKRRIEQYFAKASREVALADVDAFEEWLRVLPDSKARAIEYGFRFAGRPPGTWRDVLAEEQRRSRPGRSRSSKHIKPDERHARPVEESDAEACGPLEDIFATVPGGSGRKRATA